MYMCVCACILVCWYFFRALPSDLRPASHRLSLNHHSNNSIRKGDDGIPKSSTTKQPHNYIGKATHFQLVNPLQMAIFNSYVKLPEAISISIKW